MSVPGDLSELDQKVEEIFDRADDLMINKKDYAEAVSYWNCLLSKIDQTIPRNPLTRP